MASSAWPRPDEAPSMDDLSKCVHCGLCVNACPTYAITGLEVESPRGRIHLARSIEEGRIQLTETVQAHWELCLQCRACEAVCPSGVPFGRIMERSRVQLDARAPAGMTGRRVRRIFLRHVVARRRVLGAMLAPVRLYANSPVRGALRRSGVLRLFGRLGKAEAQLPPAIGKPFRPGDETGTSDAATNVSLFTGCVMGEIFGDVHRATLRVLARSGVSAEATAGQVCCGALHAHDGDIDFARKLARRNIDALGASAETIVVNSAGCGAAMKEYGYLLSDDEKYRDAAVAFSARVKDVTEYLAGLGPLPGGVFAQTVAYQDPCHLAHAQRIRTAPRQLLGALNGCELVETADADVCCGAAGMYSMVQPEMSGALRERKAEQFRLHRPDVIVTANPGCHMQYYAAVREAGIPARVMHVVEVIDEAQRNAGL